MATAHEGSIVGSADKPLVGATMYGTTTRCVDVARAQLEADGYEVLVFHATGAGGRSMEALMKSGHITASLDVTTTELMSELAGGTLTAGPHRFEMAGELGLPQVVSVGAADIVAFTPPDTVPAGYQDRTVYAHNPSVTLIRSSVEENVRFGRTLAEKLNQVHGSADCLHTADGERRSMPSAGGVFNDPVADEALFSNLKANLDPAVEVIEIETDINDPEFGLAMAKKLHEHYQTWRRTGVGRGAERRA